jgi:hypothetical protein
MRPVVENEVEFQKSRAFRRSPLVHHIGDSAKCRCDGRRTYARVVVLVVPAVIGSRAARWWHACGWPENRSYVCARNLWGADATGNGARSHRAVESAASVRSRTLKQLGSGKGAEAELPEAIEIEPKPFSSRELRASNSLLDKDDLELDGESSELAL